MFGSSKRSEPHWLNRFELILLAVTASTVVVVTILDFVGVLDQVPWLAARVPTLTLLLIGSVSAYLVIERRKYLEEMHRATAENLSKLTQSVVDSAVLQPLGTRQDIGDIYRQAFASASKSVDMMALTGEKVLGVYETTGFSEKIQDAKCDVRILILAHDSPLWDYRFKDEGPTQHPKLMFEKMVGFCQKLKQEVDLVKCRGSLQVRYHDRIPYFAYFRADDTMILGLYYSFTVGDRAHAVKVAKGSDLFDALAKHFEALWHADNREIASISYRSDPMSSLPDDESTASSQEGPVPEQ